MSGTNKPLMGRRRPAVALCLVGVWFSGGCNIDQLVDQEGNLRETTSYRAAYEDTLLEVARRFKLGYVEMVAANPGTDPWLPGEGTEVVLPTVHLLPDAAREGIVINLADMRLYYFPEPNGPPRSYPIGIGRDGLTTPLGTTEVVRKRKDPTWHPTARMREEDPELAEVVPPGPDNPLGSRAMYLGWPTYLIHGTNKPWGIGRRSSSGCIRMYPEDAEELFDLVDGRDQGHGGRPADQARVDRWRAVHGGAPDPAPERRARGRGPVHAGAAEPSGRRGDRGGR